MKNRTAKDSIVVLTIGHSTRELDTFIHALQVLIALAGQDRVALMCAETVPWRCHRSLIADALVARGAGRQNMRCSAPLGGYTFFRAMTLRFS